MKIDPTIMSNIILIITAFSTAFLVALWLSLIFWTVRDTRQRIRDKFVRILAIIIVIILFLPGVLIYIILRPQHTLEDDYQRSLEEEALLQSIEETNVCPNCGRRIRDNWLTCPNCHSQIKHPCRQCKQLIESQWKICPYCGTLTSEHHPDNFSLEGTDSIATDINS